MFHLTSLRPRGLQLHTAGANGWVVAYDKIEQSWSPKIVSLEVTRTIHHGAKQLTVVSEKRFARMDWLTPTK